MSRFVAAHRGIWYHVAVPEKAQENLQLLVDISLLLSTKLDIPELLTTILEMASRVVGAERSSLFLLDPVTEELYFDVALGLGPEVSKMRLKLGQGIAGTVARDVKPVIVNDARADSRWTPSVDERSGYQTRSILAVPMLLHGKVVGVVEAINHIDGPFSFMDLRLFEAFAAQAAIAVDNARLFASLREEKTKLDTVFSQMRDAAVLTDEHGRALLLNEAARRFFALEPGKRPKLQEELQQIKVTPPFERLMTSRDPVLSFEAERNAPKKLFLSGTVSLLRFLGAGASGAWEGRLFVFRDVTEERQEELLKRSFLSLTSHKLKTPLSSITGYAQVLLDDPSARLDPDKATKALEAILSQGLKLSELVDKLLRFIAIEELDTSGFLRRPFALDDALERAAAALGEWLDQNGATVAVEPRSGETAFGDPRLIQDAVKNLIENGVKFDTASSRRVTVWAESREDCVAVHVRDQGPGIPPEDQEKIFGKFYQVENAFTGQVEGWGLGLPFVKKVVEQHGGKIWLQSRLQRGTTVSFTLPRPPSPGPKK